MKTYSYLLSIFSACALATSAFGAGADSSAYQGAIFNGDSPQYYDAIHKGGPQKWSVGIGLQQQKRTLTRNEWDNNDLTANYLTTHLGYDVTKWFTLYGEAGEADVNTYNSNRSSNFAWLAGGQLRILDYMVLEPWNDFDNYWVGVDLNGFYRGTTVDFGNNSSRTLSEVFSSLTMSFMTHPTKQGLWDRVGFYVGPAFSTLSLDDLQEDQAFGFIAGLQLNPTPNWGIKVELQKFDDVGMGASVLFHF